MGLLPLFINIRSLLDDHFLSDPNNLSMGKEKKLKKACSVIQTINNIKVWIKTNLGV